MNPSEEQIDSPRPKSRIRPVAWTVFVLAPLLLPVVAPAVSAVLVGLWCVASIYLVAVPSRFDDEVDPDGRRAVVKVAAWLFGIIAAFVSWNWTLSRIPVTADDPDWASRLVLVPHNLFLAINLCFALLELALFRPESLANRLLLLLGIPVLCLVCAGAWDLLFALLCVV